MGLKNNLSFVLIFIHCIGFCQNKTEVGTTFDNDLYTSTVNDKYYTNGFEFYFRRLQTDNLNSKTILEYKLGQKIYNPFAIRVTIIERTDRPFAGYLYASVGKNTFYKNGTVFKKSIQIGYVGPNSFGEEVQELFHNTFGYKKVLGWENQIQNALAIQGNLFYAERMNMLSKIHNTDFHWTSELDVGTILNGITTGPLMRIGIKKPITKMQNSVFLGGGLTHQNEEEKRKELFLYIQPQINFQLYDATIQGSIFDNNSPVVRNVTFLRFKVQTGVVFKNENWSFSYNIIYKTKETTHPENEGAYYGSIAMGYFFK